MAVALTQKLKAIGDPVRLRILKKLPGRNICQKSYNVSELARELKIPQSSVSRQLAILLRANLVQNQRMCCDVYYWVDRTELKKVMKELGRLGQNY